MKHLGIKTILGTVGALAIVVSAAAFSVPNAFESGDVVSSAQMNENFGAVATSVSALEAQVAALQAEIELPTREGYFAYAWANQASSALGTPYEPSEFYAFEPAGPITVTRTDVGVYNVAFGDATRPVIRNVQITGYGAGSSYCTVGGWDDHVVTVRCFDDIGVAEDNRFTIWVAN